MTDKEILGFVQGSKNILEADSDDGKEMDNAAPVFTSSEMMNNMKRFSSSKKLLNCPEVNTRFVYGMRQIGKCFSAGFKLCGTLNLPRLSKTAYTNHENKLMLVNSEVSELSMQKAASELLVLHPTTNKIVECGISVDGTWQRRGYSSMNGCVAALSFDTGKVVDIEIMSSYCPTCRKISKMPRSIESEAFCSRSRVP
ncbi:uncharacterized protein TNCV_2912311 [Trichonephila clavipes]|nr:uncharacterized protein TNCV_2912311 [Trichonephila clavipes]